MSVSGKRRQRSIESKEAVSAAAPPKKRGRPKSDATDLDVPSAPSKRGRPIIVDVDAIGPKTLVAVASGSTDLGTELPKKKKKGRPKNQVVSESIDVMPKKKGRPKKKEKKKKQVVAVPDVIEVDMPMEKDRPKLNDPKQTTSSELGPILVAKKITSTVDFAEPVERAKHGRGGRKKVVCVGCFIFRKSSKVFVPSRLLRTREARA